MSRDRSWEEDWRETWLADAAYVSMLDRWVRRRHIEHHEAAERRAHDDTVGPWIIAGLVGDTHRHAIANNWLWATTAISMTGRCSPTASPASRYAGSTSPAAPTGASSASHRNADPVG